MPRIERAKKDAEKILKNIANATGQTTIASFFTKKTEDSADTTQTSEDVGKAIEREADEPATLSDSCESVQDNSSVVFLDTWIKEESEFNEKDKYSSKIKGRFFQSEWLKTYKWLRYNGERHAAFCEVCTQYRQAHDNSPFIYSEFATGFCNWKKGTQRLTDHERSENHKNAMRESRRNQPTIAFQLDDHVKEQQRLRRQGLVAHLDTLKTLLRQGVPIRGHTDKDSNIFQFNKDKAVDNAGLNLLLKENQYMSHDILAEQEEMLVLSARKSLLNDVNASEFYSIICDESSDISKTEQLSFSVRHCSETYEIFEDFLGVMPCDGGL